MWPYPRRPSRRLKVSAFPVLANQVRCASGFRHAPKGRTLHAPPLSAELALPLAEFRRDRAETIVVAQRPVLESPSRRQSDKRPARLLVHLVELADAGAVLPSSGELGMMLEPRGLRSRASMVSQMALKCLEATKTITLWTGPRESGGNDLPRAIRLPDGRVLRNRLAPPTVLS
jgi:hypothetical protein